MGLFLRTDPEAFRNIVLELALLTVYFLVITFAIAWLRRHEKPRPAREAKEAEGP